MVIKSAYHVPASSLKHAAQRRPDPYVADGSRTSILTRLTLVRFTPDSDQTADIEQVAEGPGSDIRSAANSAVIRSSVGSGKQCWYRAVFLNYALTTS
jgi:hypothetical protein